MPLANEALHIFERAVFENKGGHGRRLLLARLLKGLGRGMGNFEGGIIVEQDNPWGPVFHGEERHCLLIGVEIAVVPVQLYGVLAEVRTFPKEDGPIRAMAELLRRPLRLHATFRASALSRVFCHHEISKKINRESRLLKVYFTEVSSLD